MNSLGIPRAESPPLPGIFGREDGAAAMGHCRGCVAGRAPVVYEERLRAPPDERWWQTNLTPLPTIAPRAARLLRRRSRPAADQKGLLELHGGRIELEGEVGSGRALRVALPGDRP